MATSSAPQVSVQDGVTVIALGPEFENLDERLLDGIRDIILDTAQTADPPWIVVDLAHTKFFGSSFIEVLFRVANRVKGRRGHFALCSVTPYCGEVLSITHLDRLWPIHPDRQSAIAQVRAGAV